MHVSREVPHTQTKADLWHSRLGHQGQNVLNQINTQHKINISLSDLKQAEQHYCQTCVKGKLTRQAIHSTADPQYKTDYPIQCLHADLVGPVTTTNSRNHPRCPTIGGSIYALIVTDEYTHTVWVKLLWNKSEATAELIKLITQVQIRTGRTVERFHSDGGGEFIGSIFRSFLDTQGTRFTRTTPSTPSHNGIAERMNRTLFEITRTLLIESAASDVMWGEALLWAAHLYNVTPHPASKNESPFKQLYNYQFNVHKLRVWGCDAQVKLLPDKQSKIQSRTTTGIFVGFDYETSSYRIMDPITRVITKSNDVSFDEHSFLQLRKVSPAPSQSRQNYSHINPYSALGHDLDDADIHVSDEDYSDSYSGTTRGTTPNGVEVVNENERINPSDISDIHSMVDISPDEILDQPNSPFDPGDDSVDTHIESKYDSEQSDSEQNDSSTVSPTVLQSNKPVSQEVRKLQDLLTPINPKHTQPTIAAVDAPHTRYGRATRSSQSITSNPNNYYAADMHHALTHLAEEHVNAAFVDSFISSEPKQYRDAIRSPEAEEWKKSMKEEIDSMERLGVWKIVPRPKGVTTLKGRWVYKNKLGDNNQLIRRKSRFVAKGFQQVYGRDFFETHSPVAKMKSIKLILSLVAQLNLELYQIDFDTAFLNANVSEDIYMEQPEGFYKGSSNSVCKLIKSIYGLKQASRNWNLEIDSFMKSIGYTPLISDSCVYLKRTQADRFILLSLYVDDTIVACDEVDKLVWESDKKAIASKYAIKDLGECEWILNMKVTRDRSNRTITLSQEAYIERIIREFNMENMKPASTPASIGDLFLPVDGTDPQLLGKRQSIQYQSMVGALLYAANITRIDIAYIVGQLCRYTSKPCAHHMQAAIQVFRYLKRTTAACLIFGLHQSFNPKSINVTAYSDANWGSDLETGKSNSGGLIRFNGDIIGWHSKRQKSVAQSSAESEYMALAETVKEALWYRSWVYEIFNHYICCTIKCDNTAAIQLSQNDSIHNRSKHISIRYHLVRDTVKKGRINIMWVGTREQQADVLTKALGPSLFTEQCDRLLLF